MNRRTYLTELVDTNGAGNLETKHKILLNLLSSKENQSDPEQVYRESNPWMRLDLFPGPSHALRPVDIVKNKDGIILNVGKAVLEIANGWLKTILKLSTF